MNLFELGYDRNKAILIYKGKIYEDELNHQYALMEALKDNGDYIENYVIEDRYGEEEENFIERNIEELIEHTNNLSKNNELFTFDIIINKYLLAHYKSNLELNYDLIKSYANENKLQLGYYNNFSMCNEIVLL